MLASGKFDYIRRLVQERSALVLEPGKEYLVESRLGPVAMQEGFSSLDGLIERLLSNPYGPLHRKVVEAMTINETTFFRDPRPFEVLKTVVLPELLKKRAEKRSLNVWFAACSSGQEPYSFAMLLREHFPFTLGWDCQLIASDISSNMLARGRKALYTQLEVNRGLPASLLLKYFKKVDDGWQLCPEIQRMVAFQEMNLVDAWPSLPRMDIVFMRNVLIYFAVDTKKAILARLRRLLSPDGYLLLGGAETPMYLDEGFQPFPPERPALFRVAES